MKAAIGRSRRGARGASSYSLGIDVMGCLCKGVTGRGSPEDKSQGRATDLDAPTQVTTILLSSLILMFSCSHVLSHTHNHLPEFKTDSFISAADTWRVQIANNHWSSLNPGDAPGPRPLSESGPDIMILRDIEITGLQLQRMASQVIHR